MVVATRAGERGHIRLARVIALGVARGTNAAVRCLEEGFADVGHVDAHLRMRYDGELAMLHTFEGHDDPVFQRLERYRQVPGTTSAKRLILALLAQQSLRRDEPCELTRELALRALAGRRFLEEEAGQSPAFFAAAALIDAEAYVEAREYLEGRAEELGTHRLRPRPAARRRLPSDAGHGTHHVPLHGARSPSRSTPPSSTAK